VEGFPHTSGSQACKESAVVKTREEKKKAFRDPTSTFAENGDEVKEAEKKPPTAVLAFTRSFTVSKVKEDKRTRKKNPKASVGRCAEYEKGCPKELKG